MSFLSRAYDWGFNDFIQGITLDDNPYLDGSLQAENWTAGYIEAQDESLLNSLTDDEKSDKIN